VDDLDVSVDPLLVPTETDTKTTTSTSGGRVMSPRSKQAIDDEYAANQATADARAKVGEAASLQEAVKADQLAQASTLARQQAADQAAEQQAQADRLQAARDAASAAEDAFAGHTFHDYWSSKGMGKRIAAGFGLFAGGLGGGENPAAQALYRDMDRDFAKQTADVNRLRDVAKMKGGDVNDLAVQQGHENAALAIKFAKANEATAAEMVQRLTEAGIPLKEAESNATVQGLRARAEEKRREALQHYDRTYSNSTSKKEVTGEGKANTVAQQRLDLQKQRLILRDPETGEEMGMKPTPQAVESAGNDLSQIKLYRDKVLALADSIEKSGHLFNPLSKEAKDRSSDAADVQSIGRNLKHIQSSDAGQKLEHLLIGGTGVGLDRSADPAKLRQLANEAYEQATGKLRATLTPLPGQSKSRELSRGAEGASERKPRVPAADIRRMQQARSKGDHRFDSILSAEGM
jgi:hypothetical protein